MRTLEHYIQDNCHNFQPINESLFLLLAGFFKWLFSSSDTDFFAQKGYRKNSGRYPWDYDDDVWETPSKRKPKQKTNTSQNKTTQTSAQTGTENQTKNVTDIVKKSKTKGELKRELDKIKKQKPKNTESEPTQVDNDTQTKPENEPVKKPDPTTEPNNPIEEPIENPVQANEPEQTPIYVGVRPEENPPTRFTNNQITLTEINNETCEDPITVVMGILAQNETDVKKQKGLWEIQKLMEKQSIKKVGKKPWYHNFMTINYLDKCVVGMLAYTLEPEDYLFQLADQKHKNYLHIMVAQTIEGYEKTNIIEDFVVSEMKLLAEENNKDGLSVQCFTKDEEQLYAKLGFKKYGKGKGVLMHLNFSGEYDSEKDDTITEELHDVICQDSAGNWRIKGHAGKGTNTKHRGFWKAKYKTREDAENALKAYFANRH